MRATHSEAPKPPLRTGLPQRGIFLGVVFFAAAGRVLWWGLGMRVVAYILLVGFLIGCKDGIRDTTRCVECREDGVKIGASRCKHCGGDPYGGGLQGMQDRVDDLEALVKIKIERGGVGSWPWQRKWPWWKWPIMFYLTMMFFYAIMNGIGTILDEEVGLGFLQLILLSVPLGYLIHWLY